MVCVNSLMRGVPSRLGYTAAADNLVVDQYRRTSEAEEYRLQLVSYPLSS